MIAINLTSNEILQFQYILPVQGSIQTLELVEKILNKVNVYDEDIDKIKKIEFDIIEIKFVKDMIKFLDKQKQLNFQSLSLIKKFLNIKGE